LPYRCTVPRRAVNILLSIAPSYHADTASGAVRHGGQLILFIGVPILSDQMIFFSSS